MTKWIFGAILGSTLLVGAAQADTVTLAELLNGGTITNGDKVFGNFTYSGTGTAPLASAITISPWTIANSPIPDYGIRIQGLFSGTGDAGISYTVTVVGTPYVITDATATSVGTAVGGSAAWDVAESLFTTSAPVTAIGTLSTYGIVGVGTKLTDHIDFGLPGYTSIRVVKDIGFQANGGFVNLSIVDQNFSQSAVPELSTWAMMLVGFAAIGFAGYRKAKTGAEISAV